MLAYIAHSFEPLLGTTNLFKKFAKHHIATQGSKKKATLGWLFSYLIGFKIGLLSS